MEYAVIDLPKILNLILALGFVLLLMVLLTVLARKSGLVPEINIKSDGKRRLKIVESLPLDARRRLVIVQCDEQQHLIVLGVQNETLIKHLSLPPSHNTEDA